MHDPPVPRVWHPLKEQCPPPRQRAILGKRRRQRCQDGGAPSTTPTCRALVAPPRASCGCVAAAWRRSDFRPAGSARHAQDRARPHHRGRARADCASFGDPPRASPCSAGTPRPSATVPALRQMRKGPPGAGFLRGAAPSTQVSFAALPPRRVVAPGSTCTRTGGRRTW